MVHQILFDSMDAQNDGLPPGWTLVPDWRGVMAPEREDVRDWEAWWRRGPFESLPVTPPEERRRACT